MNGHAVERPGLVSAVYRQLCPRCREGAIFRVPVWRGLLSMHDYCPVCGLRYLREPGYFMGAMYVSYLMSIPPVFVLMLLIWHWTGWRYDIATLAAFVAYLPFAPVVTRYARVIWMYLDQHFDPERTG